MIKQEWPWKECEPVNLASILEQAKGDAVHGGITPTLIEEAPSAIQVGKVVFVFLTAPEGEVGDFKVGPEMASTVTMGFDVVVGAAGAVDEPGHGIVFMDVFWMSSEELDGLGPQGRDGFGGVEKVDVEAVGLVVVLHVSEDVVVDIAEEFDVGLYSPVVLGVLEGRVAVEHATVPTAHLMVADLAGILDVVFFEDLCGFFIEVLADPAGHLPVFFGDDVIFALCGGGLLGAPLEFVGKGDVVEEGPGVVVLVIPGGLELFHGGDELAEFFVSDEGEEGGIDAW